LHGDAYGSTIQQVILECPLGATYEIEVDSSGEPIKDCTEVFQTKHIVTEAFKAPGEYPVVLRLTDSRGNIFSYWLDSDTPFAPYINVVEYSPIEILNTAQGRQGQCLENEDLDAWYARISFSFSNYTNKNPCILTLTLIHHDGTEIPIEIGEYVSGDTVIINSSVLNCLKKDESYKLVYTITDQFTAASVSRLIGSSSTFMRWEPSNNAIGFGCYPSGDNSNCVEIAADWNLIVNGDILFPDESGTYMTLKEVIQQIISEINDQV